MSITISADFPGGNIIVERIEGEHVWVRQDQRDTPEWWFYWCFRIDHVAGRTVTFNFTGGDVFGAMGPCFSRDGHKWEWLGREVVHDDAFSYTFPTDLDSAYFSFCIPYLESHLRAFLATHPEVETGVLTMSEQGRPVEHLALHSARGTYKVLLTARHHACESMANYEFEGILAYWQSDEPLAAFLREQVDLHAIPFIDKDGVERGDQGKLRQPHDHNLDYTDTPQYASTRALMAQVGNWRGQFALAIDLHCPWIRGAEHEEIFIAETDPAWMPAMQRFITVLETVPQGPLRYDHRHNIAFGVDWHQGIDLAATWFQRQAGAGLAFTLEFPYALTGGQVVTVENTRQFGADLARTIARYLNGSL